MDDDEIVDEIPKERKKVVIGSAEEARTVEHQNDSHVEESTLRCLRQCKSPTHAQKETVAVIEPNAIEPKFPVKFGAPATADHPIKNDDGEEDDGVSTDTAAVVLLDRGTGWIDVYPKGSKTTEHTVEAFQHFAGAKDKVTSFYCDKLTRAEGRSARIRMADLNRHHKQMEWLSGPSEPSRK